MNKFAIAFLAKNKTELSKRSIEPLLQPDKFDLFIIDGSDRDSAGAEFATQYPLASLNVRGGPDSAIAYALTRLLGDKCNYDFIGLHEQDVLLHQDWWGPMFALFERGRAEGLEVGAVSARCYEDRLLVQRAGFGLCHNLGSGQVLFTREAAQLILDNYRTTWSTDNRLIFCQLSGLDIGAWWAFRGAEQWVTCDWGFDAILARHGLASLALTPSLATMLDQDIASQGLKMADGRMDLLRNQKAFAQFSDETHDIRTGVLMPGIHGRLQCAGGIYMIFAHQIPGIGGRYSGDWRLKWAQGFGPFVWESASADQAACEVPVLGPCEFLVGGRGKVRVTDTHSGYTVDPDVTAVGQAQILQVAVPSGVSYRTIRLEALNPGVQFFGIRTREPQPWLTGYRFDHSQLPKVGE